MKTNKELLDEYHTEFMVQTRRSVPGANFTRANELYLELSRRLTKDAADASPIAPECVHVWLHNMQMGWKVCDNCGERRLR